MKCNNSKCDNNLSPQQQKGGQKFCCRACSNSAIIRRKGIPNKTKLAPKIVDCKCIWCGMEFQHQGRERKLCGTNCRSEYKKDWASKQAATSIARGTKKGWQVRSKLKPSYPEQYFIDLFKNENLEQYEREKKVGKWFIDFAFNDLMLAVEIDGKQHEYEERKESDRLKDEYLSSQGWKVFRVKWVNPTNEANRESLYQQIDQLKTLLS